MDTERVREMEQYSKGIPLADENLGRRVDRFTTDAKLAELDSLRAKYDPDNLFNPWMGRVAPAPRLSA